MSIFKGEYEHALDAKGRVAFPSKLRKFINPQAQDSFTLIKGLEKCLYLYPDDKWLEVEQRISQVQQNSAEGRMVIRQFLRSAENVALDNQNRIALPQKHMDMVGISSKVVFIGAGERIELWAPEILDEATSNFSDSEMEALFEKAMGGISI